MSPERAANKQRLDYSDINPNSSQQVFIKYPVSQGGEFGMEEDGSSG